jgi:anti-sigma regulatory factor (Ser/Thr protein kinase)
VACDSVLHDYSLTQGELLFTLHHDLSASPIAAVQARGFVADAFAVLDSLALVDASAVSDPPAVVDVSEPRHELVYRAQLVVTELVNNALMHARTELHLGIACDRHLLLLAVADGHPAIPSQPDRSLNGHRDSLDGDYDESGRGMMIVASLADDFGWRPRAGGAGKVMWVTLAVGDVINA